MAVHYTCDRCGEALPRSSTEPMSRRTVDLGGGFTATIRIDIATEASERFPDLCKPCRDELMVMAASMTAPREVTK